jgi:hypothetical protein
LSAVFRPFEARRTGIARSNQQVDGQILEMPASQRRNTLLCLDQGAPSVVFVASDPSFVMLQTLTEYD